MAAEPRLHARHLTRRLGYRTVLRGIDLSLGAGDALALVGPNGAGKTTLLRILAGLLRPSGGEIERHGRVGLVAHHTMLYDALSARENLAFAAKLAGVDDGARIDAWLERIGLWRWRHERTAAFSRGMLQRLAIARALVHDPDILLLDEPLSSLDEPGIEAVVAVFDQLRRRGCCLVLVTHQYETVVRLATCVAFLIAGTLEGPEQAQGRSAGDVARRYRSLLAGA